MKDIKLKSVISLLFFLVAVWTFPCNEENKGKDFIYPQIYLCTQQKMSEIYYVKGILVDSLTHEVVPYATVSVQKTQNKEKVIKMSITNNQGEFNVSLPNPGRYIILFKCVGMKNVKKEITINNETIVDVGTIYACSDIHNLKDVTIVSRRKLIKIDVDKLEYNVEGDPSASVSSTWEILKKVPFVTITGLDKIKLNGTSNFKVYIDGHSSITITAQNMSEVLKSIPANTIKAIQIITNPDAKYDAEGISGIINIIHRKAVPGYLMSLSGGVSNISQNGRIYSTVQFGKISISGNASLEHSNNQSTYNDDEFIDYQSSSDYKQVSHNDSKAKSSYSTNDNVEISYDIDSLKLFTFAVGITADHNPGNVYGTTKMYASDGSTTFSYNKNNFTKNAFRWFAVQSNYQQSFRKKGEMLVLSYQLNILRQPNKMCTDYTNIIDYSFPYTSIYRKEDPNTTENTFQVDYTYPITSKQTIESGMKCITRHNRNDNLYYNSNIDNDYVENADQSLYYHQSQNVYALYSEYVLKEKKWSAKGGLRYEYTSQNMNESGSTNDSFTTHYGILVPSASLFWNINESSNLDLSYVMRISRPGLSCLNPHITNDDPLNIYYGNPLLKCEKSNSLNAEYNYTGNKININVSSGYSFINNSIESYTFAVDKVLNHTYLNIGNCSDVWTSIYLDGDIFHHLHGGVNANWTYNQYRNIQNGINRSGSCYNVDCNLEHPILWHITMNIDGSWDSPSVTPQGKECGYTSYNVSLRRSFIKNKLTVSLQAYDFFRKYKKSSNWEEDSAFRFQFTNHYVSRYIGINVNYNFGKLKKEVSRVAHSISNTDLKKK